MLHKTVLSITEGVWHIKSTKALPVYFSQTVHTHLTGKIGFMVDDEIVTEDNCGLRFSDGFAESGNNLDP